MKVNPLTQIDFYKADHRRQYPEGTELVYSNFTPRSTKHAKKVKGTDDKITFFGLQYFIKYYLIECWNEGFFKRPKEEVVAEYKRRMDTSLGKDAIPVDHIEGLHDLGYLPILIRALPEGVAVNERVPVFTIENTHPKFFWITNYLESVASAMNWRPCTSATIARKYRSIMEEWALRTVGDSSFVDFQGHDFSFRGMGGIQDAVMSGAGHALFFKGSDTVPAIDFLEDYYNANAEEEMILVSVPASEHSCMSMGSKEGEFETFKRFITELYPKGIVSVVSDTWDYFKVLTDYLPRLKDEIMSREGKTVCRPDSGVPIDIIAGKSIEIFRYDQGALMEALSLGFTYVKFKDSYYRLEDQTQLGHGVRMVNPVEAASLTKAEIAELEGSVGTLWGVFGGTRNDKGYRQLHPSIGLIYGDSITLETTPRIFARLAAKGFASTNVVLGIGSYTYVYNTRDTYGFAMKATAGRVNGEFREIFKDPKTDDGVKKSARGLLAVQIIDGEYTLVDQVSPEVAGSQSELKPVFQDGQLLVDHTLYDVRKRAEASLS